MMYNKNFERTSNKYNINQNPNDNLRIYLKQEEIKKNKRLNNILNKTSLLDSYRPVQQQFENQMQKQDNFDTSTIVGQLKNYLMQHIQDPDAINIYNLLKNHMTDRSQLNDINVRDMTYGNVKHQQNEYLPRFLMGYQKSNERMFNNLLDKINFNTEKPHSSGPIITDVSDVDEDVIEAKMISPTSAIYKKRGRPLGSKNKPKISSSGVYEYNEYEGNGLFDVLKKVGSFLFKSGKNIAKNIIKNPEIAVDVIKKGKELYEDANQIYKDASDINKEGIKLANIKKIAGTAKRAYNLKKKTEKYIENAQKEPNPQPVEKEDEFYDAQS